MNFKTRIGDNYIETVWTDAWPEPTSGIYIILYALVKNYNLLKKKFWKKQV